MKLYNTYEKIFSPAFIAEYHGIVLHDLFNQILAFLLFPLKCSCRTVCHCSDLRENARICLNIRIYNNAKIEKKEDNFLYNIRLLLRIPESNILTKYYLEKYSLRMIKQHFKQIDRENYFRNIEQFVWSLIHFNKSCEILPIRESDAITKEDLSKMNLAKKHLKTNAIELQKKSFSPDQENFWEHFKTYKSICHFIAAYEFMKREKEQGWQFSLSQLNQVQRFLNISFWFQTRLVSLKPTSHNGKIVFSEDRIVSLPSWIQGSEIDIPIQIFDDNAYKNEHL